VTAGRAPLLAAALVGCVVAANVATARLGMVPAGFGLVVSAGTWAAGLALVMRDALDRAGGLAWVLGTITAGVALSAWLAGPALAVASAVAFALSELADLAVFRQLRRRTLAGAVAASNAAGAVVDTLVFLPLAGFGLTAAAVGGQLLVKAGWLTGAALLVLAVLRTRRPA
jgi:uncharacterized PurR-regulated membrane protein YhhQ (DUF165 family)